MVPFSISKDVFEELQKEARNNIREHEYAHQTCYELSDRVIASLIAAHGDEKGLKLPPVVAPEQVIIVPIIFKEKEEIKIVSKKKRKLS